MRRGEVLAALGRRRPGPRPGCSSSDARGRRPPGRHQRAEDKPGPPLDRAGPAHRRPPAGLAGRPARGAAGLGTGLPRLGPGVHPRGRHAASPEWLSDAFAWRIERRPCPRSAFTTSAICMPAWAGRRRPDQGDERAPGPLHLALTPDAYQHVTPALEEQAAATVARLVFGPVSRSSTPSGSNSAMRSFT